jgi:hypothetical protein
MSWQPPPFDPEQFASDVRAEVKRLTPLLPDIDPDDLVLIVQCKLRPFGTGRRYFLREQSPGVYVF